MNNPRLTTDGLTTDDAAMPSRPTRTLTLNSLPTPDIPEDCKSHHSTSSHMTTDGILRKVIPPSLPPLQRESSFFLQIPSHESSRFLHHTIPRNLSRISITIKVTSTQVMGRYEATERRPTAIDPGSRWRSYKLNRLGSSGLAFCAYLRYHSAQTAYLEEYYVFLGSDSYMRSSLMCCCSVRFPKRGYGCCRRELAVLLHTLSTKIGALVCVISQFLLLP